MRFHWLQILQQTEYLLLKRTSSWSTKKKSIEANYYPSLSLTGGITSLVKVLRCLGSRKPSDGVYWSDFASVGLNLRFQYFQDLEQKQE
jgi:hypothetical protein